MANQVQTQKGEMQISLPEWAWSRRDLVWAAVKGERVSLPTLTDAEKAQLQTVIHHCDWLLHMKPEPKQTLDLVKEFLMATSNQTLGESQIAAKGSAYMVALDDLPSWAIMRAVRAWYRHETGNLQVNYGFPDSGALREVALREKAIVEGEKSYAARLLVMDSKAIREEHFSDEYRQEMLKRIRALFAVPSASHVRDSTSKAS